jgi:protein-disulfide isomerase
VVRWVFKHLPLGSHPNAVPAAIAAECAHQQGLFWPMHQLLFEHQNALGDEQLASYAEQIGVNLGQWRECRQSTLPRERLSEDRDLAARARVTGTPTFFVNGRPLLGALPPGDFLRAVDDALDEAEASQEADEPPEHYYAALVEEGCG